MSFLVTRPLYLFLGWHPILFGKSFGSSHVLDQRRIEAFAAAFDGWLNWCLSVFNTTFYFANDFLRNFRVLVLQEPPLQQDSFAHWFQWWQGFALLAPHRRWKLFHQNAFHFTGDLTVYLVGGNFKNSLIHFNGIAHTLSQFVIVASATLSPILVISVQILP